MNKKLIFINVFTQPKAYEFGYQVKDDYSGNNYNRQESSDGNQVRGEYRVALPDGRTQIVTYYADWQSGFHADVRYEGTAQYPEQYNQGGHGGYNNGGQQYGAPSQQYGAPAYNNHNNNNNNNGYSGGYSQAGSATSSVHIKDYSSEATPYNINNNLNSGYNYNNNGNNYDSYNSGSFNKRPTNEYGAP